MLIQAEAEKSALNYIRQRGAVTYAYRINAEDLVLINDLTIPKEYGWWFFIHSRKYLATQNDEDYPIGIGPILVEKESENVLEFATAQMPEKYIEDYEIIKGFRKTGLLKWIKVCIIDRYWFLRILFP